MLYEEKPIQSSDFGVIWECCNFLNSQIGSRKYSNIPFLKDFIHPLKILQNLTDEKFQLLMRASKYLLTLTNFNSQKTLSKFFESLSSTISSMEKILEDQKNKNVSFNYKLGCTDIIWNFEFITRVLTFFSPFFFFSKSLIIFLIKSYSNIKSKK